MKKKEAATAVIVPTTGTITSDITLGLEKSDDIIEAEVIEEEDWGDNHPNFIESNTQEITLEELQTKNVIPTFVDGTLTLSHQNFIGAVKSVAEKVFGELLHLLNVVFLILLSGEYQQLNTRKQVN